MRWKIFGEMSTDDGHKVYFSGEDDSHEYGVGFLVHKDVVDAVLLFLLTLGCRPVSNRLISIRLRAAPFNITFKQVYLSQKRPQRNSWCFYTYEQLKFQT